MTKPENELPVQSGLSEADISVVQQALSEQKSPSVEPEQYDKLPVMQRPLFRAVQKAIAHRKRS